MLEGTVIGLLLHWEGTHMKRTLILLMALILIFSDVSVYADTPAIILVGDPLQKDLRFFVLLSL